MTFQRRGSVGFRRAAPALLLGVALTAAAGCGGSSSPQAQGGHTSATPTGGASTTGTPSGNASSGGPAGTPTGVVGSQRPAPVESNPPGDIPDNVAYIGYRNAAGRYSFSHPEGWASVAHSTTVTFTDKLNGITAAAAGAASAAPTVASAKQQLPQLVATQPAFELRTVRPVSLPGGSGVLIVFRRNSAPDPVTGKVFRDEVNRYEIYRGGRLVVLDLFGAVGSDNVDPYTKISDSLRLA